MLTFLTGLLTGHPARKYVVDFIRTIVVDSFSHHVSSKSSITLDVVLDVSLKIWRIHLSIIKRKNNEYTLNVYWVNKELFFLYKFVLFISKRFLFLFWFNRSHFVVNYSYCDYSKMSIKLTEVWSVLRNTKIVSLKNNPGYLLAFKNC